MNQTIANGPKHLRGEAQPLKKRQAAPDFSEAAVAIAVAAGSGLNGLPVQINLPVNDCSVFI